MVRNVMSIVHLALELIVILMEAVSMDAYRVTMEAIVISRAMITVSYVTQFQGTVLHLIKLT